MKLVVSACLLGCGCRYNGKKLQALDLGNFECFPVCPEVMAGLEVPRPPAELRGARVINSLGQDLTQAFIQGALEALELVEREAIELALLKENSPSCGVKFVYDGSFSGKKISGQGIFTSLLLDRGIRIFSENELDLLEEVANEKK